MSTVLLPTPEVLAQFNRDGFLIVPDVLTPAEVATYRTALERVFAVPNADAELYGMPAIWRPKLFEHGPEFDSSIDHPGVAQFIDAVLGDDCHLIAHTGLKTSPGKVFGFWHQDDHCRFPIPDGLQLDPRIPMPTFTINMNYYLCDVDEELGPTQFIPGSHRAGRVPRESDNDASGNPTYAGRSLVNSCGKAGTLVLWNDQTWHRGGPNLSNGRIRWVLQTPFARRWVAQRFWPFVNYRMPEDVIARANPRRKRLLGFHNIGAYG
ncbi:MAG: phytanoyl-CoA dioxygenase family protein [Opitutaceae bacterium]|nr:phytanoyl-CoA dioxygenase family protein [Opitutaceae bacterium]